ncbi:MAG TPA: hypothetical protein PLW50_00390 [Smithellaceae bacterium]|nr:hypothetical protein [Smithellaceae bacterium]
MGKGDRYFIYESPRGALDGSGRKIYFEDYAQAWAYVLEHRPPGGERGIYHINPVDKSGFQSKNEGRVSFGEGNKEWEKRR